MNTKEKLEKIKNLKSLAEEFSKGKLEKEAGVFIGENVVIEPYVFFDTKAGNIVLGNNVIVRSGAVLRGPLIVGDFCKIGGEIEHSIFENYSNKQHYGYVGHSYVGAWVNIGGGTSIATLKNTYSTIKLEGEDTGEQFLGAILEDGVKTSVNSSIFCGKVIGSHSHIYGVVTEDVPAFVSHIRTGVMYELPLEVGEKVQKAMMKRRNKDYTQEYSDKLKKIFEQTQINREKVGVKKEKLKFD